MKNAILVIMLKQPSIASYSLPKTMSLKSKKYSSFANFWIGECSQITDSGNVDLGLAFSHSLNDQHFPTAGFFSLRLNHSTRCS